MAGEVCLAQGIRLEHDGKDGVWFDTETAKKILIDVEKTKTLELKVQSLEYGLKSSDATLDRLRAASEIERQYSDILLNETEISIEAYKQVLEENQALREVKTSTWRHPVLWFTIGFVLSAAVIVSSSKIIK